MTTAYTSEDSDTRIEKIVELIRSDPGLAANVPQDEIDAAVDAVVKMNAIILDAIDYARANGGFQGHPGHFITEAEVLLMNEYIRSDADRLQTWTDLHGDDEDGEETGFHLVQNDGATTRLFGSNAVNTVLDGMYHLGFEIGDDDRFDNEDGNANASVSDVATWLNYFFTDFSTTNTPLDQITETILDDPGLLRRVTAADMNEGAGSANAMNVVILEAAGQSNIAAMDDGHFTVGELYQMNAFIQENYYDFWVLHHGDDEDGEEWGFHCVQNDGATTQIFGKNYVNTVADGIYHMGFDINNDGRFLNEDGNANATVDAVAAWLNYFMFDIPLIQGGGASETLTGTDGMEQILGEGGHDTIYAGAGGDWIVGGAGNDTMYGEAGDDRFIIGSAGPGWDTFFGGDGTDVIDATDADYVGLGRSFGADNGIEVIKADVIQGYAWSDVWDFSNTALDPGVEIHSNGGHDTVTGTDGDDTIFPGTGNDTVYGLGGNDVFVAEGDNPGWDNYFGGDGTDTVDGTEAAYVGLGRSFGAANGIEVIKADVIQGYAWSDVWDFSNTALDPGAEIHSNGGHDTVTGTDGDDTIFPGTGNDTVYGLGGNDVFVVEGDNPGWDNYFGGDGTDTVDGTEAAYVGLGRSFGADNSIEVIRADVIRGYAWSDVWDFSNTALDEGVEIHSGGGHDTVTGTNEANSFFGGTGNDTLTGLAGNDVYEGGDGRDVFVYSEGDDRIVDFQIGSDRINLTALTDYTSFEDLSSVLSQEDEGSVLDFGDEVGTLTLSDMESATLSDGDFIFAA